MEKKNINEVIANLSVEQLAGMIDHTFLKPFGTAENIEKLCAEARQYQFAMVAINPAEVETCVKLLEGSGVRVGAAIGFPLGQNTVECKAFETRDAIAKGATEIDTVINVRALDVYKRQLIGYHGNNLFRFKVFIVFPVRIKPDVYLLGCFPYHFFFLSVNG